MFVLLSSNSSPGSHLGKTSQALLWISQSNAMSAIKQSQLMTGGLLIVGTCDILSISKPIISPVAGDLMPLSAGLQLAEELAGAPVDRDDALRVVEDLPDVGELLVSAGPLAPLTSLALAGAGVCLVLLGVEILRK